MHLIKFTTSSSVCKTNFSNILLVFVRISHSENKTISVCSCKNLTSLCVCSLLTRIWIQCHDHVWEEPGPPESGVKGFNLPLGCFNDLFKNNIKTNWKQFFFTYLIVKQFSYSFAYKYKGPLSLRRSHITEWVWWINLF